VRTKKVKAIDVEKDNILVVKGVEHRVKNTWASSGILHINAYDGWSISVTAETKFDVKK